VKVFEGSLVSFAHRHNRLPSNRPGTFTFEKNTLREAKESAESLRELGLWVIIIGPDGKTLDNETKDEPS
jgi:hypothetical protein